MRRGIVIPIVVIALAGCSSLRDVFTSHSETAARVGARQLKSAKVAGIISRLGGANPAPQAGDIVTGVWVDLQLFGDRVASGTLKADSATLGRLLWAPLATQKVSVWHDTVVARRSQVSAAAVDSAYNGNDVRIFQHILVKAAGPKPADTTKAKAEAERILPQAKSGDFAKAAAKYSGDTNKSDGGYLQPAPKGAFVPEFENAAWALNPGEVSGVVKTQYGFHIIRRPPVGEVRDRLIPYVKQRLTARADSAYMADLSAKNDLRVKSGAPAAIRSALTDLTSARQSGKVLVTYKSGQLTVSDLVRWLSPFPAPNLNQVRGANDTILETFARTLAQNEILLKQADSAKITISPSVYEGMSMQLKSQISDLKQVIGLDTPLFSDSSKTPVPERRRLAAEKVDTYFEKLSNNQAPFKPVPPSLSSDLRATGDFKMYQAGISRAMELVMAQHRQDSAAAAAGLRAPAAPPPPPPGLQPAPGGPPRTSPPPAKKP